MIEKASKILDKGGTHSSNKFIKSLWLYDTWTSYSRAPCFDMNALNLIFYYLTGRKQRVKINSGFSSYLDIFQGNPQGSILGPLLFNLFLCDLFLFLEEGWYYHLRTWWHSVCVFWKCWRHSRKTRGSRKSNFWMVFKQYLKCKRWQMSSHLKYG